MKSVSHSQLANQMYEFAIKIFPLHRSITGNGVRQTLSEIQRIIPDLIIHEVPTGTKAFDWEVPDEWNIRDAYVIDPEGNKVIDYKRNNLHVVSYSIPVNDVMSLEELDKHLYSLTDQPDVIPYVTSYYQRRWGFCIPHNERKLLKEGEYRVVIDSTLEPGNLTYGELILSGREKKEILLSTYICHPSLANNEVSGPVVSTYLANWLQKRIERRYTYRVVFVPETIGSIVLLSRNLNQMKSNTIAGFVITCVGDDRAYSFIPSRTGNTLADKVALHILKHYAPDFKYYSFLYRASDERQYCSPRVDLPVVSIMRSKHSTYPEYHTSLDDLSVISPEGLLGAYKVIKKCLVALEKNHIYQVTTYCEPQLGKRGLYPTISEKKANPVKNMVDLIAYCDGNNDLISIAELINLPIDDCYSMVDVLLKNNLLEKIE